jgi:hypothetical protein
MNDSPRGREEDTPDRREGCRECDPKQLDDLKCRAKGIKAQSDYNDATLKQLDDNRTAYDAARHAYSEARKTAKPVVERLELTLSGLIDQLDCLVQNSRKIAWLNEAYETVESELRQCYPCEGCTFDDDCDFDDDVDSCGDDDLETLIARITLRTAGAQAAFDDLKAEATEIPKRVTKLQADVDKIEGDMKVAGADFVALYAAALVARGDQKAIYRGFHNVNDYMDCLCKAFMCVLKGHEAIGRLKGKQAVRQCHDDQRKAHCERLKTQTAEEVIAEYLKLKQRYHRHHEEAEREQERESEQERDRDDQRGQQRDPGARRFD